MKKSITFLLVFSVMILFVAGAFAQTQGKTMRGERMIHRSPARILRVLKANQKELNITDSQLEEIKNLVFSFEEKMIQMKNDGSLQRLEMRKLFQDREKQDFEKIKAALSKASNIRNDMFIERLKLRDEIGNILTPEQRDAMKAMQKDRLKERRPFQRGDRFQRFPRLKKRIR